MRIAIDAMGGDHAPEEIVQGAVQAARDFDLHILLVGDETAIRRCLPSASGNPLPPNIEIVHTTQTVEMDEAPMQALKQKKDSSLAVAFRLHAEGRADAVLSAGNTGAAATHALFILKRIKGVDRPGIATVFPTLYQPMVLMDAGANVDVKPRNIAEFAVMGAAYASAVRGIIPGSEDAITSGQTASVGLLSIGEEATKGNELTKSAHKLLVENAPRAGYLFHGNVEGRDLGMGTVNVMVCDGFVGNVVLKVAEGMAKFFSTKLKEALTRDVRAKAGALLLTPSLKKLRSDINYNDYGGAVLLGVNGVTIISHGSSDRRAIYSALRITKQVVLSDVVELIRKAIERAEIEKGDSPPKKTEIPPSAASNGVSPSPNGTHSTPQSVSPPPQAAGA